MIRRSSYAVILALLAALPASAADRLSYSFWEAGYLNNESQPGEAESDEFEGFRLALGIGLSKHVHFLADYDQLRPTGLRLSTGSAGLGVHTVDRRLQFFLNGTYERDEFDNNQNPQNDEVEEGWGAEGGVRAAFTNVELFASYKHIDFGGEEVKRTGARYGGGLALQLSPWWSLTGQYRILESTTETDAGDADAEDNQWTVGFRRYFATDADRYRRKGGVLTGEGGFFSDVESDAETPVE